MIDSPTAKSLIGVSYEQSQDLVAQAEKYEKKQEEPEKVKTRINAKGKGRPPKLFDSRKIMFVPI